MNRRTETEIDPETAEHLERVRIVAAGLAETARAIVAGGAPPEVVLDAALLLAVRVLDEHLEPDDIPKAAGWLRMVAAKLEAGELNAGMFHA